MIKLEIEGEVPELERTVKFAFRRHHNAAGRQEFAQQAFLVGDSNPYGLTRVYPVKIDGLTKTVEIRRGDFEALGFTVTVK